MTRGLFLSGNSAGFLGGDTAGTTGGNSANFSIIYSGGKLSGARVLGTDIDITTGFTLRSGRDDLRNLINGDRYSNQNLFFNGFEEPGANGKSLYLFDFKDPIILIGLVYYGSGRFTNRGVSGYIRAKSGEADAWVNIGDFPRLNPGPDGMTIYFNNNFVPYRYYDIHVTGGNVNSSPWTREMEFIEVRK